MWRWDVNTREIRPSDTAAGARLAAKVHDLMRPRRFVGGEIRGSKTQPWSAAQSFLGNFLDWNRVFEVRLIPSWFGIHYGKTDLFRLSSHWSNEAARGGFKRMKFRSFEVKNIQAPWKGVKGAWKEPRVILYPYNIWLIGDWSRAVIFDCNLRGMWKQTCAAREKEISTSCEEQTLIRLTPLTFCDEKLSSARSILLLLFFFLISLISLQLLFHLLLWVVFA